MTLTVLVWWLAICACLFVIWVGFTAMAIAVENWLARRRARLASKPTTSESKTSHTFQPEPTSYLRDVNPGSFGGPASKGFEANLKRAEEHHAAVVLYLDDRRNQRTERTH